MKMRKWYWFVLSVLILSLDQLSKYWALGHLGHSTPTPIFPMLSLSLSYNTGAAFGFLNSFGDWHRWFFASLSLVMSVVLSIWLVRIPSKDVWTSLGISLILGGALGNLIDRLFLGYVVDFIDVYYKNHHWPLFNLADSAICVGAIVLFFCLSKERA